MDPALRREQVADAVIDEIDAHGLGAVTLARLAARSGFAIGSIRHYFGDTLGEVMRFTASILIQRAQRRAPEFSSDPATRIVDLITFTAPTTEQERKENAALVEYRVLGRTDPEIGAEIAAAFATAEAAIRSILSEVLADRVIDGDALGREAFLLATLVEGFSLSSALTSALTSTPVREEDVRAVAESAVQRMRDAYPRVADAPTAP